MSPTCIKGDLYRVYWDPCISELIQSASTNCRKAAECYMTRVEPSIGKRTSENMYDMEKQRDYRIELRNEDVALQLPDQTNATEYPIPRHSHNSSSDIDSESPSLYCRGYLEEVESWSTSKAFSYLQETLNSKRE